MEGFLNKDANFVVEIERWIYWISSGYFGYPVDIF
jgi:hypothetical protein